MLSKQLSVNIKLLTYCIECYFFVRFILNRSLEGRFVCMACANLLAKVEHARANLAKWTSELIYSTGQSQLNNLIEVIFCVHNVFSHESAFYRVFDKL